MAPVPGRGTRWSTAAGRALLVGRNGSLRSAPGGTGSTYRAGAGMTSPAARLDPAQMLHVDWRHRHDRNDRVDGCVTPRHPAIPGTGRKQRVPFPPAPGGQRPRNAFFRMEDRRREDPRPPSAVNPHPPFQRHTMVPPAWRRAPAAIPRLLCAGDGQVLPLSSAASPPALQAAPAGTTIGKMTFPARPPSPRSRPTRMARCGAGMRVHR